jgi:hypothetical protein
MLAQLLLALMPFALTAVLTGPASAQTVATNFSDLRFKVKPGDTIYVTATNQQEARGTVLELTPSALVVSIAGARQELDETRVARIRQRVPDPVWNGAAIGAAVYLAVGGIVVATLGDTSCSASCWTLNALLSIGIGGSMGAGIDSLIRRRATIYERDTGPSSARLRIRPLMSQRVKGVFGTIEW